MGLSAGLQGAHAYLSTALITHNPPSPAHFQALRYFGGLRARALADLLGVQQTKGIPTVHARPLTALAGPFSIRNQDESGHWTGTRTAGILIA